MFAKVNESFADADLNGPEHKAATDAAFNRFLAEHGWTREEWRVELEARMVASREAMLKRIEELRVQEQDAEWILTASEAEIDKFLTDAGGDPEAIGKRGEEAVKALLLDRKVRFGLREQGHLPLIEAMLREGSSWDEIGRKIGWDPETARKFYEYEAKKGEP
jgi:hypothetical protein